MIDTHSFSELQAYFGALREKDFPTLREGPIYLDSAATSLKPAPVIETLSHFYMHEYGTVHRAVYSRANHATALYNEVRRKIADFLGIKETSEIVITRGTTDGINIIADSLAVSGYLEAGRSILLSEMEHHSNIVPWQIAAKRTGAKILFIPVEEDQLDLNVLEKFLREERVAVVSCTHCSNILGTINPLQKIGELIRKYRGDEAFFCVDGAQSAPHMELSSLSSFDVDFFLFSSHKMSGPTGVGALYGKKSILEKLTPSRGGGDMIDKVSFIKTTYAPPPLRFEPGTPAIGEAIGFGRAISYLQTECLGMDTLQRWEHYLTQYLRNRLLELSPDIQLIGNARERGSLQSFLVRNTHPLDIATFLDLKGVSIRSGHLCGQPLLSKLGVSSLLRASCAYYNTIEDIDFFIRALKEVITTLA